MQLIVHKTIVTQYANFLFEAMYVIADIIPKAIPLKNPQVNKNTNIEIIAINQPSNLAKYEIK